VCIATGEAIRSCPKQFTINRRIVSAEHEKIGASVCINEAVMHEDQSSIE
jgi:hypothetical protein